MKKAPSRPRVVEPALEEGAPPPRAPRTKTKVSPREAPAKTWAKKPRTTTHGDAPPKRRAK